MPDAALWPSLPTPNSGVAWIKRGWDALNALPYGKQLFSRFLGNAIPYTGSIDATMLELRPGFARVELRDQRKLRNHLDSVHAIALCNLAELTANSALAYSLPDNARFIVTEMHMRYLKKARGVIQATCQCPAPLSDAKQSFELQVELRDAQGELVASATVHSLTGAMKDSA